VISTLKVVCYCLPLTNLTSMVYIPTWYKGIQRRNNNLSEMKKRKYLPLLQNYE